MEDQEYRKQIRKLIRRNIQESLENNGKINYETQCFEILKKEVKENYEKSVVPLVDAMICTAERSNCVDRLLILELIDYFFTRSHSFREALLLEGKEFLEMFCETDPIHKPLPGKAKNGEKLKVTAILTVKKWEEKFVDLYIILGLLVDYLKTSKSLDYEGISAEQNAIRVRKEKMERRKELLTQKTFSALQSKFSEIREESEKILFELNSALRILVPNFIEDEAENADECQPSTSSGKRTNYSSNVTVIIPDLQIKINVDSENDAIVENVIDLKALVNTKIAQINRVMKRSARLGKYSRNLVPEMIQFREELRKSLAKADDLKFVGLETKKKKNKSKAQKEEEAEDDDDEFIDVEDLSVDQILMIQYGAEEEEEKESKAEKEAQDNVAPEKPGKTKKSSIPIVPYGLDLKYWGEERKDVQIPKNNADCHRFWRPADEDSVSGKAQECIYTQRVFPFIGEQARSDKICRARMPNGSLCPRRDFKSCPLHGRIVERDNFGFPVKESDKKEVKKREELKRKQENAAIVKDIEAEMGISLEGSSRKKHVKRRKDDTERTHGEDVRNRLEKKLLNPRTINRVSQVLDASRKAKLEKKFGQQFSHLGS